MASKAIRIETFFGQRVAFANKSNFDLKWNRFKADGLEKLSIVSDFDFTITKFWMGNGIRGASCHKVIEDCGLLSEEYHEKAQSLQKKYYAIEVDPELSLEEKVPFMIEWVNKAHSLLTASGLTKDLIQKAVSNALKERKVALRARVDEFFQLLTDKRVPTLVFSAGIADVLQEVLQNELNLDWTHIHVISNRCVYDNNAVVIGFTEPVLHVFNKKSSTFLHTNFFQTDDIGDRKNLLLLGDSLGDVTMAEGMNIAEDSLIKIGYLNDREERLPQYLESFDIVILDDPGFDIPLEILKAIG